ncbi:hypothetical protein EUTSA_v10000413mg [Eutrema salsugineum]|uniref:Uncharacterized protein n=1 Tax=Eutrema salsugineum TaxID=72664 RepID=V4NJ95_EUTSA|nr:hypothetical protein EUTSA_v10000413mg [Eutrema salsugineum]
MELACQIYMQSCIQICGCQIHKIYYTKFTKVHRPHSFSAIFATFSLFPYVTGRFSKSSCIHVFVFSCLEET